MCTSTTALLSTGAAYIEGDTMDIEQLKELGSGKTYYLRLSKDTADSDIMALGDNIRSLDLRWSMESVNTDDGIAFYHGSVYRG